MICVRSRKRPLCDMCGWQSDTLQPEAFTVFAGHLSLECIDANLGTDKRSYRLKPNARSAP